MLQVQENISLKSFNTFGMDVRCKWFVTVSTVQDFEALVKLPVYITNRKLIVGGGSNILFTKNFEGLVIKNNFRGIGVLSETEDLVLVRALAGEVWHDFVMWCIDRGYGGLENLSLIPGCVGASPMQNIGAYGVEIKDVFEELEALDMNTGQLRVFKAGDCEFGYRESVFKHKYKDRYFISSVTFKLTKKPRLNTSYGAINTELQQMNIATPGIRDVSNAVIRIRQSKLPDPSVTGNAGSFFKNPEVSADKYALLKQQFEDLVAYLLPGGNYKLAAGWLIEQCGLKGYEINGAAVHLKQALVLINKGGCSGEDVYRLSEVVMEKVFHKFGVSLEREVNIV